MAGQLQRFGTPSPGFFGLNSQDSEVTIETGFATEANNCIIDRYGRLGSRRGWLPITTNRGSLGSTEDITSMFELKDTSGSITYITAGGNTSAGKLFLGSNILLRRRVRLTTILVTARVVSTVYSITSLGGTTQAQWNTLAGTSGLTYIVDDTFTATGAGVGTGTISTNPALFTNSNWQIASLAAGSSYTATIEGFLGQIGEPLLTYTDLGTGGGLGFYQVGTAGVGTVPAGTTTASFDPNCVLSAYGRIWAAGLTGDKHTVYYSALLDGATFTGASAGILDISAVVGNSDEIVGLSDHNGFLIIFCKNNILVYANAKDPVNIVLSDTITGVGCISRDSIQKTGTDLLFLSKSGLRSLSRTIQEKSLPMRELSINIRDTLVDNINNEIAANIKSVYFERDAFYLLSLPSSGIIYCFDMRTALENGAARVTTWAELPFKCFCVTEDRRLLLGVAGGIANYFGYTDNAAAYRMSYLTSSTDVSAPGMLKFLKKASITILGSDSQVFFISYGFDYSTLYSSRIYSSVSTINPSEYNIAEFGIGEYAGGLLITEAVVNLGGSGRIIKLGVSTDINGAPVSLQSAAVYLKLGRLL